MKPPPFEYFAPTELSEAIERLAGFEGEAKVIAGGQSLVPMMNMRLARPAALIDIRRIEQLNRISTDGDVRIGATVTQYAVRRDGRIAAQLPVVIEALQHVGHVATQSRGTFCGSIAHADPAAELPALLVALDGEVVAEGIHGRRAIRADDFFKSYFTTDLTDDEIVTEVRLPQPRSGTVAMFTEVARRYGDFALVGACAVASFSGPLVTEIRVVAFGVGHVPMRLRSVEELLSERELSPHVRHEAAQCVHDSIAPQSDLHASSDYRRDVVSNRVLYLLEQLAAHAR